MKYLSFILLLAAHVLAASDVVTFFSKPECEKVIDRFMKTFNYTSLEVFDACLLLLHQVPTEQLTKVPKNVWPALSGDQLVTLVTVLREYPNWQYIGDYHLYFPSNSRLTQSQMKLLYNYPDLSTQGKSAILSMMHRLQSTLLDGKNVRRRLTFDD